MLLILHLRSNLSSNIAVEITPYIYMTSANTTLNRAVACDVTNAAFNQNVWQKCVAFVQEGAHI